MRCPKCGFVSFDFLDACKKCGADLRAVKQGRGVWAAAGPPAGPPAAAQSPAATSGAELQRPGLEAPAADGVDALFGATPETEAPVAGLEAPTADLEAPAAPTGAVSPPAREAAPAHRPAGFWIRLLAFILDGLIVDAVIVGALAANLAISGRGLFEVLGALPKLGPVLFVFGVIYTIFFWAWRGATPGKMALGLKIVMSDGTDIGFVRALVRYVGYFVSGIILGIGFLMIAFTRGKRGLHDKLADTQVIRL